MAVKARCASGEHRPYYPKERGRNVVRCLDCGTRLPDERLPKDYVDPYDELRARIGLGPDPWDELKRRLFAPKT